MPQPLTTEMLPGVLIAPDGVTMRPECALKIAQIISTWSMIEDSFRTIYSMWLGDYMEQPGDLEPGWMALRQHPASNLIFDRITSLSMQIDLLLDLCEWREKDQFITLRDEIRPLLLRAGGKRNTVAHGVWGLADKYPDALILVPTFGARVLYRPKDFDEIIDFIAKAREPLTKLQTTVYQRRVKIG